MEPLRFFISALFISAKVVVCSERETCQHSASATAVFLINTPENSSKLWGKLLKLLECPTQLLLLY